MKRKKIIITGGATRIGAAIAKSLADYETAIAIHFNKSKTNALKFFETPHCLTAQHLCKMHRLDYSKSHDIETLDKKLADFYKESTQPKLLEIFTPSTQNDLVLKEYINSLK